MPPFDEAFGTLIWLATLAGVLAVAVPTFVLFHGRFDANLMVPAIAKLMRDGDHEKARKLCALVPFVPLARVTAALLDLRLEPPAIGDPRGAYRSAPREPSLEERARRALQPIAERELSGVLRLALTACLGGVVCAGTLLLPPWSPVPTVIAAVGVVAALWSLAMYRRARAEVAQALAELPPLVRARDVTVQPPTSDEH
jgi:hypothetical protein